MLIQGRQDNSLQSAPLEVEDGMQRLISLRSGDAGNIILSMCVSEEIDLMMTSIPDADKLHAEITK